MRMYSLNRGFPGLLLVLLLLLAGCGDSSISGTDPGDGVRITGRVSSDTASKGEVDDATVRSKEVDENGTTSPSDGETQTDESGRYVLETSADSKLILVTATKEGFESQVLVDAAAQSSGSVGAITMSHETAAEADVYLESRRQQEDAVTLADVAAYVSAEVATQIRSGSESAARVALSIGNAERTRQQYAAGRASFDEADARNEEESAYRAFQGMMTGDVSVGTKTSARADLESRVALSLAHAGADASVQAQANQTARAALVSFSAGLNTSTKIALRKRAEIMAALATTAAIRADLQASGSSSTGASLAADAGADLIVRLESAQNAAAMDQAWSTFRSDIQALVAAELGLTTSAVQAAVITLASVEASFNLAVESSTSVEAIVQASSTFYTEANSRLKTALSTNAKAGLAADILMLTAAR